MCGSFASVSASCFLTVAVVLAPIGQLELAGERPPFPVATCRGRRRRGRAVSQEGGGARRVRAVRRDSGAGSCSSAPSRPFFFFLSTICLLTPFHFFLNTHSYTQRKERLLLRSPPSTRSAANEMHTQMCTRTHSSVNVLICTSTTQQQHEISSRPSQGHRGGGICPCPSAGVCPLRFFTNARTEEHTL